MEKGTGNLFSKRFPRAQSDKFRYRCAYVRTCAKYLRSFTKVNSLDKLLCSSSIKISHLCFYKNFSKSFWKRVRGNLFSKGFPRAQSDKFRYRCAYVRTCAKYLRSFTNVNSLDKLLCSSSIKISHLCFYKKFSKSFWKRVRGKPFLKKVFPVLLLYT